MSQSRRKWIGSGLLAAGAAAAQTPGPAGAARDLGTRTYNIRDFGAKGDGVTLDTAAVQAAIDACHRDQGGTVLVPAGVFVIGTIELKSNVALHLAAAGKLLGSADGKQYRAADAIPLSGDSTMRDGNVGLIFAVKADNIAITGPGTIDGQGAQFRSPARGVPPPSGRGGNDRPYHVLFHQCTNVAIRGVRLVASAYHSVRIIQSRFVEIDGIHIYNRVNGNNDGFHFISAEYVHISNCDVEAQDDACALFGSSKYVTVTNSSFSTRWSVFRFGGGEAENITVSNCLIYETYGCPVKMQCGPHSRFENISFANLVMKNVTGPISINLGSRAWGGSGAAPGPGGTPPPGIVRNISFSGIRATVVDPVPLPDAPPSGYRPGEYKTCIVLNGADGYLENISFNDFQAVFPGGGTAEEAAREVPPTAGEYFELGILPAYALYARRVRGLTLANVRFQSAAADLRPAVRFESVEDAAVNGFSVQGHQEAASVLRFTDSRDVLVTAARLLTPARVFLRVEGAASRDIRIDGGDLSKAAEAVSLEAGAPKDAVKLRG